MALIPDSPRWKARLIVSLIMLALAFITLLVMKIHPSAYWLSTCVMAGIDAIICVWLVWYIKRDETDLFVGNVGHMVLHWIGFIAVIYLITVFIHQGAISEVDAGIYTLIVLAFTIYLAGIYTDVIFILVGITLALLATGAILIKTYLLLVMIPVIIIVALIIFVMISRQHQKIVK